MKDFCDINYLKSLIKEPTCLKNSGKPTCIDLILTNRSILFQHSSTFKTDLSDFHLLTVTEFKIGFPKLKPKVIVYRDYKNFDNAKFRYDIVTTTSNVNDFGMYKSIIFNIFSIIKKYICANEAPFMSKELHKAIMKRSRLRNKFLKHRTETTKKNYSTKRNLCKKLLKNTKKTYFENLDTKKITDNRSFWRTVPQLFTQNSSKSETINLIDDSKIISSDEELCETFNQFFSDVVPTLSIPKPKSFPTASDNLDLIIVIKSFDKHPSIVKIKAKRFDSTFHFRKTSCNEAEKIISNLNIKKSSQQEDIATKIIKLNKDLIAKFIAENFNSCIQAGPSELKHADIVPIHKKKDKKDKSNYRPVSILSNYSEIYEKLIYNQLYQYFENILFQSKCGFRKGYSTQHCLLVLIEKFKAIDTGNKFGALLADFSKSLD